MKRQHIHLSDQQRERLLRLSQNTGLNVAELIRRSIDAYLDEAEAKMAAVIEADKRIGQENRKLFGK
jgi:predicted DNA-binding protein